MINFFKAIKEFFKVCIGLKSADAVDAGIVDYSGQGRDKHGK